MNWDSFLDELIKIADLRPNVHLRPHQEDAVNFIVQNDGRGMLAHGTGSGKTLSSLAKEKDILNAEMRDVARGKFK
jgi:superfamily II DNA or RNA helicase